MGRQLALVSAGSLPKSCSLRNRLLSPLLEEDELPGTACWTNSLWTELARDLDFRLFASFLRAADHVNLKPLLDGFPGRSRRMDKG